MILKLEQIPKRSLEIEKPDGSFVTLVLKRFPLNSVPVLEKELKELDIQRISGELDTRDYYNMVISLVVDDFVIGCLDDLDIEHITAVSEKLQELRQNKPAAEKKSRGI